MTNKELQEQLRKYPDDIEVKFHGAGCDIEYGLMDIVSIITTYPDKIIITECEWDDIP